MNSELSELLSGSTLKHVARSRANEDVIVRVKPEELPTFQAKGWILDRKLAHSIRLKKVKPERQRSIDRFWILLNKMGFSEMNDSSFKINAVKIDVVAADQETVILGLFPEIDINHAKNAIVSFLKKVNETKTLLYKLDSENGRHHGRKIAIAVVVDDYNLSDYERELLGNDIKLFNSSTIAYYEELEHQLKTFSKYQLQGYLFAGKKIPNLETDVPAIKGQMGQYTFYSFSLEPEKLFKIGYVLHRNNANEDLMPTYQRIVKAARLKKIQEYVNEGGFFPNSIIVNFETKVLNFDKASLQVPTAKSKIGILHIPQKYMSAYIIDGQHRLYGYAGSKFAYKNTIPVVAFVNLDKQEQVQMFMDINENQKSVPKNLRMTLTANIMSASANMSERQQALESKIVQVLAQDPLSPIKDRVQVGENTTTDKCYLTLDSLQQALDKGPFLDRYSKKENEQIDGGILDTGKEEETTAVITNFLESALRSIKDEVGDEWDLPRRQNFILTNPGIYGLIRILGELLQLFCKEHNENAINLVNENVAVTSIQPYLDSIIKYYTSVGDEERLRIKQTYGGKGRTLYWRSLQNAVQKDFPNFKPAGLVEFIRDNDLQFNNQTYELLLKIEINMRYDFKQKLEHVFKDEWVNQLPKKVYEEANLRMMQKNYGRSKEDYTNLWDNLMLINFRDIAMNNWERIFQKDYSRAPSDGAKGHSKAAMTSWIQKLNEIRNKCDHAIAVSESELGFVSEIYQFIPKPD